MPYNILSGTGVFFVDMLPDGTVTRTFKEATEAFNNGATVQLRRFRGNGPSGPGCYILQLFEVCNKYLLFIGKEGTPQAALYLRTDNTIGSSAS